MPKYFKEPKSKFLKVECNKCSEKQTIFNSAANKIKCRNCGEILAEPTGGKAKIKAKINKTME
ncbi:MAG: 30S ribosomal protein S27e [archaeon]